MSEEQPNFSAIFSETFDRSAHPIRYGIRSGPDLLHDLAFISSLTHDARVLSPDVQPENGCVNIALNRDCWELGYTKHDASLELHIADSALQLTGVQSVHWHFKEQTADELWLHYLWIDPGYRDDPKFDFYLVGEHWKCTIALVQDDWTIRLADTEMPYLWSSRNSR